MSKVGTTAHIEIKPILNEEALAAILDRLENAFVDVFERRVEARVRSRKYGDAGGRCRCQVEDILADAKGGK